MAEVVAETERLRLREWDDEDEVRFYEVMNRPEVMKHLGGLQRPDEWRTAYTRVRACQAEFGHAFWIVEDRISGDILGFCGIKRVNSPGSNMIGEHEIGWRLRPEAWGKGIAKEAAIASLDLAFGRFEAPHVIALTVAQNEASWGLMRRLGMTDQLAEAETRLPDPVDVDRDGVLLEELGLSMDLIVDRLGGSAW